MPSYGNSRPLTGGKMPASGSEFHINEILKGAITVTLLYKCHIRLGQSYVLFIYWLKEAI